MESEQAQATVGTVALLPALLILAVAAWQGLVIGWTAVEAQQAARAGGRAGVGGGRPGPPPRRSLPATMREGAELRRSGHRLVVSVQVPAIVPGFRMSLSASAAEVGE